jgi:hypothetical protein
LCSVNLFVSATYYILLIILVADLVLSDKLVEYDLEKHVIGWTDYNCKFRVIKTVLSIETAVVRMASRFIVAPVLFLISGSSSIKIKDDSTGAIYTVDAHNISSGWRFLWHKYLILLLVTMMCSHLMLYP